MNMFFDLKRSRLGLVSVGVATMMVGIVASIRGADETKKGSNDSPGAGTPGNPADPPPSVRIIPGSPGVAIQYYKSMTFRLGLNLTKLDGNNEHVLNLKHTLGDILTFGGYQGLSAEMLDQEPASKINDPATFAQVSPGHPIVKGQLTAVNFFAPKITDVSAAISTTNVDEIPRKVGFRKVIRVIPRRKSPTEDSDAQVKGISEIWILYNYFVSPKKLTPLTPLRDSGNIQVILKPETHAPDEDSAYFLVYGPTDGGPQLTDHLAATFDARHPFTDANAPQNTDNPLVRKYFVPTACAVCHGEPSPGRDQIVFPHAKLNFLDTDHWNQRASANATDPGTDFPDVQAKQVKPLLDSSFADFVDLNTDIHKQSLKADGIPDPPLPDSPKPTVATRAVDAWLKAHAAGNETATLFERSLPGAENPAVKWDPANDTDRQLLPLLDRYCYRCHSSIVFNVYDKEAVKFRAEQGTLKTRLTAPFNPPTASQPDRNQRRMPQDRELDTAVHTRLLKLIVDLAKQD